MLFSVSVTICFVPSTVNNDRRGVLRAFGVPSPLLVAGGQVVGDDCPVALPAELCDGHAVDDDRRACREEPGHDLGERVLAPDELAVGGVQAGENPAHAQRDDLSFGHRGRTSGPRVPAGRPGDGLRRVLVLPQLASVGRVQAERDLIVTLAGEDIELVSDQGGRGIARAHRRFPLLRRAPAARSAGR